MEFFLRVEDIYDGLLYKECMKKRNPQSNKYIISLMWYTDGAPIFKSRKYSIWPVYMIINELPYAQRIKKENIIIAGLWFGPHDPMVNMFLQPIYNQLATLRRGVECDIPGKQEKQIVKAFLLCGTCDTPARADFFNHTRFNGHYGCLRCVSKGYNVGDNGGPKNTHIYPYEGALVNRSHEAQIQYGVAAARLAHPVVGVKGPTIFSHLMPDVVRGTSIDVMYCVYLGIVKKILELWLDPTHRYQPFSLSRHKTIIDARIMEIQPNNSIKRLPRSVVNHLSYWKASELKTWFFIYSVPILEDLMEPVYFTHYLQLLLGIYLLNQGSITTQQIHDSRLLLLAFVSKFQVLYGPKYISFNIHSLLHLPDVVEDLGPLWITSCFPFEDLLGKMVNFVHGTRHVGLQIYSKIARYQCIWPMVQQLNNESNIKKFCAKLLTTGKRINVAKKISNNSFALGQIIRL